MRTHSQSLDRVANVSRSRVSSSPPIEHLVNCSRTSLQGFRLKRLNEAQAFKRQAAEAIRSAVEAEALALFAKWMELHGEEMIALIASAPDGGGAAAAETVAEEPASIRELR